MALLFPSESSVKPGWLDGFTLPELEKLRCIKKLPLGRRIIVLDSIAHWRRQRVLRVMLLSLKLKTRVVWALGRDGYCAASGLQRHGRILHALDRFIVRTELAG